MVINRPRPGDVVSRRKGLVTHYGVVLDDGRVLHNAPGRGERAVSLVEFRAGRRLRVHPTACPDRRQDASSARPDYLLSYNLLTNNCEHTVSRVVAGEPRSPQLRGTVVGIGVAALTFVLTRHPALTLAGYALGRRLGGR